MDDGRKERQKNDCDARFEFISSYVLKSLRLKYEKWHNMITTEDFKIILCDWLDNVQHRCLFFTVTAVGTLIPSLEFTRASKSKLIFFVKRKPTAVCVDNFRNNIIIGDLSSNLIENLSALLHEVFLPLLGNISNRKTWPQIVLHDVDNHVRDLQNILSEVKGNILHKTILPINVSSEIIIEIAKSLENCNTNMTIEISLDLKNSLEGMVIKWVMQIDGVLKESSSDIENISPVDEVMFWRRRMENLENLYNQLKSPIIKAVATILKILQSVYFASFDMAFKKVLLALHEAKDITLWISPLSKYSNALEELHFTNSKSLIKSLVHVAFLISVNSSYYRTTKNTNNLLRAICNLLVVRARDDVQLPILFQAEPDEGVVKISKTIATFQYFRTLIDSYSSSSNFPSMPPSVFGSSEISEIFIKLNKFYIRLQSVEDIFKTATYFQNLDRMEIGGPRGKMLTLQLKKIDLEFKGLFHKWTLVKHDLLDLNINTGNKSLEQMKNEFLEKLETIERKLGTVLLKGFEDCFNITQFVKLAQMTGRLLQRPIICSDLKHFIMPNIIKLYSDELEPIAECLRQAIDSFQLSGIAGIVIDRHFPPVAGVLMWTEKLRYRIDKLTEVTSLINSLNLETLEKAVPFEETEGILFKLNAFRENVFSIWTSSVDEQIVSALNGPILIYDIKEGVVRLNMEHELATILREVKTMMDMKVAGIPQTAIELHGVRDEYWHRVKRMSSIVDWYAFIREETDSCELKIIADELQKIDTALLSCRYMTWSSYDELVVESIFYDTKGLCVRIRKLHSNLKLILTTLEKWKELSFFQRSQSTGFLDMDKSYRLNQNHDQERKTTKHFVIKLIIENFFLLFNYPIGIDSIVSVSPLPNENRICGNSSTDMTITNIQGNTNINSKNLEWTTQQQPPPTTEAAYKEIYEILEHFPKEHVDKFRSYLDHVDKLLSKEILAVVRTSLENLKFEMDNAAMNGCPLVEVKLHLRNSRKTFVPSFDPTDDCYFPKRIGNIIDGILAMAKWVHNLFNWGDVKRQLMPSNSGNLNICEDIAVAELRKMILCDISETMLEVLNYVTIYDEYEFLWMTIPEKNDHHPTSGLSSNLYHSIEALKSQIDHYQDLYDDVQKLDERCSFRGWLVVDVRGLKHAILNEACKWANYYKQCLLRQLTYSLEEMEDFINDGMSNLERTYQDDDLDGLLSVMKTLKEINERTDDVDTIWKPLKDIVSLLKTYNVRFDERIYVQLDHLPTKWLTFKSFAAQKAQQLTPSMQRYKSTIKDEITFFHCRLDSFLNTFRKMPLFSVPCEYIYNICDTIHSQLSLLTVEFSGLSLSANLFGLQPPNSTDIFLCSKEIRQIKQLWDFILVIESCIEKWKLSQWKSIDVEDMENECKKFTRDLRMLDTCVRQWQPYMYIESTLKSLILSARVILELQNPALTERHWIELMHNTKVGEMKSLAVNEMLDYFGCTSTLSDILSLGLQQFEEDVKTVVEKAVKEMTMVKVLSAVQSTWDNMKFEYEIMEQRNMKLLRMSELLVETLENDQVQLQNIASSKFISFLFEDVGRWQNTLSTVEKIFSGWMEVQQKWMYLESIFIGSADIRAQLLHDAEQFEQIDRTFRQLLSDLQKSERVIEIVDYSHLNENLEDLLKRLIVCEKALNNYLEAKRILFPRFYFISAVDLLDILSNGNSPQMIGRHLTKLFDSILSLKFIPQTKNAAGMFSKENSEFINFCDEVVCTGNVEIWLNTIIEVMRSTLRQQFRLSLNAYKKKIRHNWLLEWPAQVALCCSQIWWTQEVNEAFDYQEKGYENAMKDYFRQLIYQLNSLISLLLGELTLGERQKIMTICTIDVHNRDVVGKIIQTKAESAMEFQWQSQLRHRWDEYEDDCFANICDAQFRYAYEYLGNTARLVITPLTDRCYITLTQSLHLVMGGAPAGPAGTGKTETTKDLGRALGVMVYVFNCSEQMDYKSCGSIYKGLAQTGAWGCFDEFNRISVEVLSVVAVQVKAIQDAIKAKKDKFLFMDNAIKLVPTVGIFITMNPGYAGRTELPENLKTLFRPCAMIVPDFALICEIMLVAQGFQEARILARKFITLYTLCKELLSKQDHYDWGLRAIKSVLVVAGSLKRSDRNRPEIEVLMRALRDFNIPKIITEDIPIFLSLIGDLFPMLEVPRKRMPDFEKQIRKCSIEMKLLPEENFVLKIVQLQELFAVRHSVFIVGSAGTGKTKIWQTLLCTYKYQKLKAYHSVLNPKTVSNDELFGRIHSSTREWRDGLFSSIMREQSNISGTGPRWIILDGDIDPLWIESLNTLMDDNKVLTLANNERISLHPNMRLLFEVGHLKSATPATVSRAGVLYINPQDLGWFAHVSSWIEGREDSAEKAILTGLFERYLPKILESNKKFKRITPIADVSMIQMTCNLLDCLISLVRRDENLSEIDYEKIFVFACVWGFGSGLYQNHLIDWRQEFHKWWKSEFKKVKFPTNGIIFDYYLDQNTMNFQLWSELVLKFEVDNDRILQDIIVPTYEISRLTYFLRLLIPKAIPIMFVGNAGCGKSTILNEYFKTIADDMITQDIFFNFYTTSKMFQRILEKRLEKKAGRYYGPPKNKRLVYIINDLNMPEVDLYDTVQPHTIIRQFMDYKYWYDRTKLTIKRIRDCQFVACMNPTAGSFTIDPRLQRHFLTFSVHNSTENMLQTIYGTILSTHIENTQNSFTREVKLACKPIVSASLAVHRRMEHTFLPTAVKFHYIFNLRDMTNIYQGILMCNESTCSKPNDLIRLYVHEATRVYSDKMIDQHDIKLCKSVIKDVLKKEIEDIDEDFVFAQPLLYSYFAKSLLDQSYGPVKQWSELSALLMEAQSNYNEVVANMNLVLFEEAMEHICRINRIFDGPYANALLCGVGGSGKQTLARLAAFISSHSVFQIRIRRGYKLQDLKEDLRGLYQKVGLKNVSTMFMMSDGQIIDENFLVPINDMLASGEIPELFSDEQVESIVKSVRNEVKQQGMLDTKENSWKFFLQKVKGLMKVVLCFSPVGPTLRVRVRKFPALLSQTYIDWFHEWPKTALECVSMQFLTEITALPTKLIRPIGSYMAYVHGTVNEMSKIYFRNEKRYNYTTPKTFLEFIALYTKLLVSNTNDYTNRIERLENGMAKLAVCSQQVDMLKEQLAVQQTILKSKNEAADKLIVIVGAENEKVKREKCSASEEERRVRIIEEDVSIKTKMCAEDLRKAEPALVAAQAALNTLNKNNLTELKSFGSPPKAVVNVCAAIMVLLAPGGKIPRDRSWRAAKLMIVKVDQFLNDLIHYDKDNIHPNIIEAIQVYLSDPEFNPENIVQKSVAAAGLCAWVKNLYKYHEVYMVVGPKQEALRKAQLELNEARHRLDFLKRKINELEHKLYVIQSEFEDAVAEKRKCQKEADKTAFTIDLAHRLINGLSNENIRWKQSVLSLRDKIGTLPGDMLLISCFLSYVGCFTGKYRHELQEKWWMPTFKRIQPQIPHTERVDPLMLISDDAQIAAWNNEGLPMDRMSTENAAILTNSSRWPLMIDPQLQGMKWIKTKYSKELVCVRLSNKGYLDDIERAMNCGDPVLIENIEEILDPVLDPLLGREFIRKGRFVRLGDKEMEINANFKLILHTKLSNPHFKPEMHAQLMLINFTVTREGLEDQLLAEVVKAERPDLERMKIEVTMQQNTFKITLKNLEDELLVRLATASKNILEEYDLVLNLEETKRTVSEIEQKVWEAKLTGCEIDKTRNLYRVAARRASILYFVLTDLHKINPIYQFSLKAFMVVFRRAISAATDQKNLELRVSGIIDSITYHTFLFTMRGLFEKDKLIFTTQMVFQIMINACSSTKEEIDFLLRYPFDANAVSPLAFLSNCAWGGIRTLSTMNNFFGLDKDIEESPKRWRKTVESNHPELELLPGEWKNITPLHRLCIFRALCPDRMTHAVKLFIQNSLGSIYTDMKSVPFTESFQETDACTPVLFILSPGVDPIVDVEKFAAKRGISYENDNLNNISLGQGQERVAEHAMRTSAQAGHWVILQNIHLVAKWLPTLEKFIENVAETANSDYRLFLTAEPAPHAECHVISQGVLESSIKIVNEPPSGMAANLHKALDSFDEDMFECCTREAEFKSILFSLCYFHAVVAERRKFGTQGWNTVYPFNIGDLKISASVLYNYLEGNNRVPWEDLRYLFGEIMYGGHITDDWDRRLCRTYLVEFMRQELIDGDLEFCRGFAAPQNMELREYHNFIDKMLPAESPLLYGLHPNAEISLLTTASENLLKSVFELQPRDSETNSVSGASHDEILRIMIDDYLEKLQDEFNLTDMYIRVEHRTPFVIVALQECERMNTLTQEIRRSLRELQLGMKGELTITSEMEILDGALFYGRVPNTWKKLAYPSLLGLPSWFLDLMLRIKELLLWSNDFSLPSTVWLGGFFNPQSFLTAIMQETARKNEWQLDKMCLSCDVTKNSKDDISTPPIEGAFISDLFLEGASWDSDANTIISLNHKELFTEMPVVHLKAIIQEKQELRQVYQCPLYKTRSRGRTYVWTFYLNSKEKQCKWILGGVALLLQA